MASPAFSCLPLPQVRRAAPPERVVNKRGADYEATFGRGYAWHDDPNDWLGGYPSELPRG